MNKTERYHLIATIAKKLAKENRSKTFMFEQALLAASNDYVNVQAEKSQPDELNFN
jgi:hypothetical protein